MNISSELQTAALVLEQALSSSIPWKPSIDVSPENVLRTLTENRISLIYLSEHAKSASNWLASAPGYEKELVSQKQHLKHTLDCYREVDSMFNKQNIDHVLIKSVGFFPPETSNVDILVRWENLARARESFLDLGYLHQKRYLRPDKFLYRKFMYPETDSLIHLHTRVSWGPPFLDEQRIWNRCQTTIEGDLRPAAEHAFMITLAHNFYEDSEFDLWDLVKLRLCNPFELDWNEIFNETQRWGWANGMALSLLVLNQTHEILFKGQSLVSEDVSKELDRKIKNLDGTSQYWENWRKNSSLVIPIVFPKVFTKAHAYLTSIHSKPTPWRIKLRDMSLLSRWASETLFGIRARRSFFVAFCGPDGSGKTTLADAVSDGLASTGEKTVRVWLRAGDSSLLKPFKKIVRPKLKVENRGMKYGGAFKSSSWQSLWLWMAVIDWLIRSLFLIRLPLARRRVVICDRYILDALVDLSYRATWGEVKNSKLVRFLIALAPRPDITIYCNVPSAILLERRSEELSSQEAEQMSECYREAINLVPDVTVIDTTQPESGVVIKLAKKVVENYYAKYESN